jgi:AmmeMemoRadiSam system protein B
MQTRRPVVAGQFYPGDRHSCVEEIRKCLAGETSSEALPGTIAAGIVPHAGWVFSGALAAMVFSAVHQQHERVDSFAIFGAAHGYHGRSAAVYDKGCWTTPLGDVAIDEDLADAVLGTGAAVSEPSAHAHEHSIEVQVPFIQHLFTGAKIVPIIVPPNEHAISLGRSVANIIERDTKKRVVCIGSTDLTHYGPRYGFTPMGLGVKALEWATKVNDREFIDLALKLAPERLLSSAADNCSACGAGAVAATVAAAKVLGKTKGVLLEHTNSNEAMMRDMGTTGQDSVGYAAIVF